MNEPIKAAHFCHRQLPGDGDTECKEVAEEEEESEKREGELESDKVAVGVSVGLKN